MSEIKKQIIVNIDLKPEELAKLFCDLDDTEQSLFFNEVWKQSKNWDNGGLSGQLLHVVTNGVLNTEGRKAMSKIGESSCIKESKNQ